MGSQKPAGQEVDYSPLCIHTYTQDRMEEHSCLYISFNMRAVAQATPQNRKTLQHIPLPEGQERSQLKEEKKYMPQGVNNAPLPPLLSAQQVSSVKRLYAKYAKSNCYPTKATSSTCTTNISPTNNYLAFLGLVCIPRWSPPDYNQV